MLRNRKAIGGILAFLIFANIVYYFLSGWGLITVKVTDAPLGKVIKSIEWQGWVKIYSNIDPETKVSMYVDHVPLAEAMDTLAANIGGPGGPPPGGPPAGAPPAGTPPGGGRGGGGFGRGAQWNLAFFVAPSSGDVKAEIRTFMEGGADDGARVFNHPTPLQILATDDEMPSADPRLQAWPGMKASTPPAPPPPAATPDGAPPGNAVTADPIDPNSLQAYLEAFAQAADIWIMAPDSWNPTVSSAPGPNSSIISAVKGLVGRVNGAVTQAIILRSGRGGRGPARQNGFAGGDAGWTDMADRMGNAINGLPPEARADAQAQLDEEIRFRKDVQSAPPDQQREMMRKHMTEKMANNDNNWRRSPAKRAQRYQRMVANRMAAQGK